jgi:hypothetical protein
MLNTHRMLRRVAGAPVCVWFVLLSVLGLAAPAFGADAVERWYVVQLGGKRAGYMQTTERTARDRITTSSTMVLKIKRDTANLELQFSSEFVETTDHKPLLMRSEQKIAKLPDVVEYVFREKDVEVNRGIGAQRSVESKPLPKGEWLTPAAARSAIEESLKKDEKSIVIRTIDPLVGLEPITTTHAVEERTMTRAAGRDVPAIRWVTTTDKYPDIRTTEFVDLTGDLISADTKLGGMQLMMLRADRDLAIAEVDPPELLNSTMITPDKAIADPRQVDRAVYLVSSSQPKLTLPSVGAQKSERVDAKTMRVRMDVEFKTIATPEEIASEAFRKPSVMISSADADVIALKDQGVPGDVKDRSVLVRAQALRRFVFSTIKKKNLDVGFATASEIARTKTGDCTEHAVLLAALLRADNIPSRVVSGLIYVEPGGGAPDGNAAGVFGYHMWTQALVGDGQVEYWVDLDATLPVGTTFDAAHIALLTSSMSDDSMGNDLVKLAPMIGTLKIVVEEVESDQASKSEPKPTKGTKGPSRDK